MYLLIVILDFYPLFQIHVPENSEERGNPDRVNPVLTILELQELAPKVSTRVY